MYRSDVAHGLMFHRFHRSGSKPKGQGSITEKDFEIILRHVDLNRIISPDEWIQRIKDNKLDRKHLCITFDDGLRTQYDIALEILEHYNLKAFWFVFSAVFHGEIDKNEIYNIFITSYFDSFDMFFGDFFSHSLLDFKLFQAPQYIAFYERYRKLFPFYSESDIRFRFIRNHVLASDHYDKILEEMMHSSGTTLSQLAKRIWLDNSHLKSLTSRGHYIGLHSYRHPFALAELALMDQQNEYEKNYQHVSSVTQQHVECMSHPLNSYNSETLSILDKLGIICGFRSNMIPMHFAAGGKFDQLEIPREDSSILHKSIIDS